MILSALRRGGWLALPVFLLLSGAWVLHRQKNPLPVAAECPLRTGGEEAAASLAELRPHLPPGFDAGSLSPESLVDSPQVRRVAAALVSSRKGGAAGLDDASVRVLAGDAPPNAALEARLAASLSVVRRDGQIVLRAWSSDPGEAALLAAAAARAAQVVSRSASEQLLADVGRRVEERLRQLESRVWELGDVETRAKDAERQLAAASSAAGEIDREIERILLRQANARLRLRSLETAEHRLRESLPSGPEEESLSSPVLRRLRQDIDAIHITVAQERLSKTPEAPRAKDLARRLAELEEEYRAELHRARARAIVDLKESMSGLDLEIQALEERRLGLWVEDKASDAERRQSERESLREARREQAAAAGLKKRLSGNRAAFALAVAGPAAPAAGETPTPLWAGIAAAALLAVLSAFLVPVRGPTHVRTDAELKDCLNLRSIAVVPDTEQEPLILRRSASDPQCEIYSAAATVLRSYLADREFKTCVVTSAASGEGKSTAAANLAVALARKGLSVALLDADLRRPRQHELFGLDPSRGLTTLLRGEETESETVLGTLEIPTLRVMASGPTGEGVSELLESRTMADLIKVLRDRYDVVILDAPPVSDMADALTLSRVADTCVWVVRAGFSDRRALGWAMHRLRSVGADVAGALLTGTHRRGGERVYDYRREPVRSA